MNPASPRKSPGTIWRHFIHVAFSASILAQGAQASSSDNTALSPIVVETIPAHTPEATCFHIDRIIIQGRYDLIDRAQLSAAISKLAVDCIGNAGVGEILKTLNGLYADAGYVTTQAYLPQQDVANSRKLILEVVPGRIGRIVYDEQYEPYEWFGPRMFGKAHELAISGNIREFSQRSVAGYDALDDEFDALTLSGRDSRLLLTQTIDENDILHVDDLQNTIDALNRVPSHQAAAELLPGKNPGTSDIRITNQVADSFRAYAGYDTETIEGVERLRFGTTVEKDNLVGVNDIWSATLRSGEDTSELSGSLQVPAGNWTLQGSADWQESTTELAGLAELYITTWNASGSADWNFQHNKWSSSTLDVNLSHREQNRYINGFALEDQRVTALSTGLSHSRFFERGSISGRIGATFGLPILNARRDEDDAGADIPQNQYAKLDVSLSGSYVVPGKASLSSALIAQWTNDVLFQSDQLTIGSRSSVRGFSNASFSADTGVVLRNEVALALPVASLLHGKSSVAEWTKGVLSNTNPYGFLDVGAGYDNVNRIDAYRVSAGLGIRYGGPRLSGDIGYGFRLDQDDRTPTDAANGETYVNLRFKFF